ncbi:MAG: hypothetical protein HFJ38_04110 [Bacilli bacterium]|nr:hypothetical protein [Bacilli bacterium]
MTESQNNNELKIIKARVEQDKYAAVELKIIKADGKNILKDLYVEKELEANSLFVASDNVLVTLHRTLKPGMVPNFQLLTHMGEVLLRPEYKEIKLESDDLIIAVKTASDMISVKNNQTLRVEPARVSEILQDSKNIKDQMVSTMKGTNPTNKGDLKFLYEDAFEEAILYRLNKNDGKYGLEVIADKISFVAADNDYIYVHSNIVPDLTKSFAIKPKQEKTAEQSSLPVESNLVSSSVQDSASALKEDKVVSTNPVVGEVPVSNSSTPVLNSVEIDRTVLPDYKKNVLSKEEKKISTPAYSSSFFEGVEPVAQTMEMDAKESSLLENIDTSDVSGGHSQVFDEFFGLNDEALDKNLDTFDESGETDRYEQLSDMISKVIRAERSAKDRIGDYEEKIKELETEISKVQAENESKTKKVSILLNQNRQLGDDNRALKNRVSGLESKTARLEEENKKYLQENKELKAEAKNRESKLSAMISSVSDLLGSYNDVDNHYAVKKKVA